MCKRAFTPIPARGRHHDRAQPPRSTARVVTLATSSCLAGGQTAGLQATARTACPSVELPSQTGKLAHDTMLCVERHAEQAPYRVIDVFELAGDGCWMSRSLRNLYDAPP